MKMPTRIQKNSSLRDTYLSTVQSLSLPGLHLDTAAGMAAYRISSIGRVLTSEARACPGRYLAEASIWIVAASVLAVYTIEPVKDEAGKPVYPTPEFEGNFIRYVKYLLLPPLDFDLRSHPKPFQCRLVPRSKEAEKLLPQL